MLDAREDPRTTATRRTAHGRGRVAAVGLLLAAVLLSAASGTAGAAPSVARDINASEVSGCCACRGTAGGEQGSIKSCVDGKTIGDCAVTCRAAGASSLVFGYQQTCSQGCAGLPTQGK